MDIKTQPYEITVWEDNLVYEILIEDRVFYLNNLTVDEINRIKEENGYPEDAIVTITGQFYDEQMIATIGSNTMSSPIKAINVSLLEKTNGERTLTFDMVINYNDIFTNEKNFNPYTKLLVNERKIKLNYKGEWYDFLIKDIDENSEKNLITYTAQDLYITELSKTGFEIELDEELENNQGTAEYLGQKILDGTDWHLVKGHDNEQVQIEPVYKFKLRKPIKAYDIHDESLEYDIPLDAEVYAFYSQISNKQTSEVQIVWGENTTLTEDGIISIKYTKTFDGEEIEYPTNLVIKGNVIYAENGFPDFAYGYSSNKDYLMIADGLKGERVIKQQKSLFIEPIEKYVKVYQDEYGDPIYGFEKTEFLTTENITNFISNGQFITSTSGWKTDKSTTMEFDVRPKPDQGNETSVIKYNISGIKAKFNRRNSLLVNTGIDSCLNRIKTLQKGQEFIVGIKGEYTDSRSPLDPVKNNIKILISPYRLQSNGDYNLIINEGNYWNLQIDFNQPLSLEDLNIEEDSPKSTKEELKKLKYYKGTYNGTNLSFTDLVKFDWGVFLINNSDSSVNVFIEEMNLIRAEKTLTTPSKYIAYGTVPTARVRTHYYYYKPSVQDEIKSIDDIIFYYEGYDKQDYTKVYNDNPFEKIRSIEGKESNRFNLIQDICEKFEVWAKIDISHDANGKISLIDEYNKVTYAASDKKQLLYETTLGKDNFYRVPHNDPSFTYVKEPIEGKEYYTRAIKGDKKISFRQYVGKDNYAGFKYGINLKSIQRKLDSKAITSKMIVKPNANEYAENGFCTIARAKDNLSKESVIYNFDYFVRQLLLDRSVVANDLYAPIINEETEEVLSGYIGYYTKLRRWNENFDTLSLGKAELSAARIRLEAEKTAYTEGREEAIELANKLKGELKRTYGVDYDNFITLDQNSSYVKEKMANEAFKDMVYQIYGYTRSLEQFDKLLAPLEEGLKQYDEKIKSAEEELEAIRKKKIKLNSQFYSKYSRFIQEGSWMSEDYIDDNLYYLDALNIMYTSISPKVTYTINTVELSKLPGYENYSFSCGDKTYMEDTEFFGWVKSKDGKGYMPYQEEIVVTEVKTDLDDPTKNVIKVQNYKTQFESLFQRIAATTQSIEYKTGTYDKVVGTFNPDGTISESYLQNSIGNSTIEITNAKNESVTWGSGGITSVNLANPAQVVRITSGGIGLSVDGGKTFSTAINGYGINARHITTGVLDAGKVNIYSGDNRLFTWDKNGLSAYSYNESNVTPDKATLDPSTFVRHDQFGIYGVRGVDNTFQPIKAETNEAALKLIRDNSYFGLIQNGFFIRSKGFNSPNETGYISITSNDDFQVMQRNGDIDVERIKIGRIEDGDNPTYGIRINDLNGNPALVSDSTGKLWLTDFLRIGPDHKNQANDRASFGIVEKNVLGLNLNKVLSIKDAKIDADLSLGEDEAIAFYDNGTALMKKAIITGGSKITGGVQISGEVQLGNMTIDSILGGIDAATELRIEITSDIGSYIPVGETVREFTLKCHIYKGNKEITDLNGFTFQWYRDGQEITGADKSTFKESNFSTPSALYGCSVTYNEQ